MRREIKNHVVSYILCPKSTEVVTEPIDKICAMGVVSQEREMSDLRREIKNHVVSHISHLMSQIYYCWPLLTLNFCS